MLLSISGALAADVKGDPHAECLRELRELAERLRAPQSGNAAPVLVATRADARRQLDALIGQLASAVELAAHTTQTGAREFDRREAAKPWRLRLAGTFTGLALATALFHFISPTPVLLALFIVVFMFLMRWAGPANYGVLVTALTALVVLLFASAGVAPGQLIAARALFTVIGGAIALVAYRAWPTWERTQVPEALARLLDGYRAYFQAVRDAYLHPGMEHDPVFAPRLERVRQAGRLARTTLEASVARLRLEPGVAASRLTALQAILANSHRFIHAVMALEAGLFRSQPVPARPAFAAFANSVDSTLYFLAAYLRGVAVQPGDLPDLREDHRALVQSGATHVERYELMNVESDRVTNSLNTLSVELIQWVGDA